MYSTSSSVVYIPAGVLSVMNCMFDRSLDAQSYYSVTLNYCIATRIKILARYYIILFEHVQGLITPLFICETYCLKAVAAKSQLKLKSAKPFRSALLGANVFNFNCHISYIAVDHQLFSPGLCDVGIFNVHF